MLSGLIFGLLMALFQSIAYLCTKLFTSKYKNNYLQLIVLSHILMGIIAAVLSLVFWPDQMPPVGQFIMSLLGSAGFYLIGQIMLFAALTKADASRISPLLGMKVFLLAMISLIFLGKSFTLMQWLAIGLSAYSVFLISNTGGKISIKGFVLVLLACVSYCMSDLSIKILVGQFGYLGNMRAAIFSVSLCYVVCGLFTAGAFMFVKKGITKTTWAYAVPFALSWFIAMTFLFLCFNLIGVVFGNIAQSTRGIISIVLGYIIANLGFDKIETKVSRAVFIKRIIAAVLMTGAIAMFYFGQ